MAFGFINSHAKKYIKPKFKQKTAKKGCEMRKSAAMVTVWL